MELQLKNIGMIKEANVKIDGLTVIAGENDTGKSTLSKVLYAFVKSLSNTTKLSSLNFNANLHKYFDGQISENGNIQFKIESDIFDIDIVNNKCKVNVGNSCFFIADRYGFSPNISMIETPTIWNILKIFTKLPMIEDSIEFSLEYPQIMKDLALKLSFKGKGNALAVDKTIADIINGDFKEDQLGNFYFYKNSQKLELINTATGIKYFGLLQVLSNNNWLQKNSFLVLDEPEVHLHPKWQLEMAKIIVELVKDGVKIVVNSHSPYMIQALIKYARDVEITDKSNVYLAQKEGEFSTFENVNDNLNKIFELLAEPMNEVFEL